MRKTMTMRSRNSALYRCASYLCCAIAMTASATAHADGGETQPQPFSIGQSDNVDSVTPFDIQVRADAISVEPVMAVEIVGGVATAVRGEDVVFDTYNNYPAFVSRAEIRIFSKTDPVEGQPLAVEQVGADGTAKWTVPSDVPQDAYFLLRLYDANGKFDESRPHELTVLNRAVQSDASGPAPAYGTQDETARRNIQVRGVTVDITGAIPAKSGDVVRVAGQNVPVSPDGRFVVRQILPANQNRAAIEIVKNGQTVSRSEFPIDVKKSDWLIVGQADLTVGSSTGGRNAADVSGDPTARGEWAIGRLAFYAKGLIGSDISVTASADTEEARLSQLFSNLDRRDPRQLLRRLNSDQYYPTYGDDSTLVEDAPSQGRFYLRLQKDDSRLVLGNFSTAMQSAELAQIDRGLYGALIDINSTNSTSFGDRRTQITAFASDPGTIPGRDEFRGTGGSIYFLRRQDVSIGSERLRIELRDQTTGVVLETTELHAQQDYDFDPFQGRVTLLRPLASYASAGSTVRTGTNNGHIPVLVARYEYTPATTDLSGYTVAGRATHWLNDVIRLGTSAQRDTVEDAQQTLLGADMVVRISAGTYIKGEIAQTDGPGYGSSSSIDGGLNFADRAAVGIRDVRAQAWRTEAAVDLKDLVKSTRSSGTLKGYYESFDGGFSSVGRSTTVDTERWGVDGKIELAIGTDLSGTYDTLWSDGLGRNATGVVDLKQDLGGGWSGKIGLRYEDRVPGQLNNSVANGERLDAATEIRFDAPTDNWAIYAFGQGTLDRDASRQRNNRGGLGGKITLTDRLSANGELSAGDGGFGGDLRLNNKMGEGSEAYVGYTLNPDRTDVAFTPYSAFTTSDRGTFVIGARQRFSKTMSVFGEQRLGHGGTAPGLMRSYGLNFTPDEHFSVTGSFENGRIDDATTGLIRRTAASIAAGWTGDGVRAGSAAEFRSDRSPTNRQSTWLFRNTLDYAANPDWRFTGCLNFAFADEGRPAVKAMNYFEGVAGFAYRPATNDRVNILARFTHLMDLAPNGQLSGYGEAETPKQVSTIGMIDVNYDLTDNLTIGGRYAYRYGRVSLGRSSDDFVSSNAHLIAGRIDYEVQRNWSILLEGRYLETQNANSNRIGALGAIYRHFGNNFKVGIGYSISDYSDDLTDQSYNSKGVFLNLLAKM